MAYKKTETKTETKDDSKTILILLAGLLLKEDPKPNVRKLERLIKVDDGTLSELFPQRKRTEKTNKKSQDNSSETKIE